MDGFLFSEQEFYQQQKQHDRRWTLAINFAVVLHVVVFAGAYYLPSVFDRKPLLDDIMTIDLVSLPEPLKQVAERTPPVSQPEPAPAPEPNKPPPEPEQAVPVEPLPVETVQQPPPEPVVEAKPISIRPLKRKIKKAQDTRLVEEKQREKRAVELKRQERERQQALAKAREEEKRARQRALARAKEEEKRALEAARQARADLAAVIREKETYRSPARPAGGSSGSKQVNSAIEKQYYMDLASRVQQLWVLPAIKKWPSTLETIVEFTVLRDGRLTNVNIAKSSGDTFFDRFAKDTVRKAAPMPPIPSVLRKQRIDLGFRFDPGGIQR